jgi:outer membrane murein-binding lipoprotein Lpp
MKTFLNVIAALALLSGPLALFIGPTIMHQLLGALVLLIACTAAGLAKLIELATEAGKLAGRQAELERDHWKLMASQVHATSPAAPVAPRWFVGNGEDVSGPFTEAQIRALQGKGLVPAEAMLAAEGTQDWKPIGAVLR